MVRGGVLLVLVVAAPSQQSAKHLVEVRDVIAAQGARQALSTLFADGARWDSLLDQVASGQEGWLGVAAQLRRVSDAHASETLDMAVQEALPHNAAGVLELVAAGAFTVQGACAMYGFGQIEDQRPVPVLVGLVDKRTAAVSAARKARLASVRDGCLKELKALREHLQKP